MFPWRKKKPKVSVIIATYNWSSALKLSITSALRQTIRDIEILVVGDGCTDDTADVVAQFNNKKLRYIGLEKNSGSQALPNSIGIEEAKAEFVAYLGHDDIWHPTHLETLFATQKNKNADFVYSCCICYGPPDTDIRMVYGFPFRNTPQKTDFAPPSTVMHKKALGLKLGGWQHHKNIVFPVDYDFQRRAFEDGAQFAHTGRVTVFKCTAGWYRDAYKKRDVSRQQYFLYQLQKDPAFLEKELLQVIKAADHGFFIQTSAPKPLKVGEYFARYALIKGTLEPNPIDVQNEIVYTLENINPTLEWYDLERLPNGDTFRWTGPRAESTLDIPVNTQHALHMEIKIPNYMVALDDLQILINQHPITNQLTQKESYFLITSVITQNIANAEVPNNLRITFKTPGGIAPIELDPMKSDRRRLGIAVQSIQLTPAAL